MANDSFKGKWALVTGASSGLGTDFARDLASRGANIILVARRLDRLQAVAQEISKQYGVQTEVIAMDLVAENAAEQLVAQLAAANKPIDILINNAGYGLYGMFIETEWARLNNMLQLDIVALTHLSHVFGKAMAARGSGYILQVASIGAYQPSPTYAAYSAAKSYVLYFGEALNFELRPKGVKVTVLSPGVTKTEFLEVSGQTATAYQRLMMMQSKDVVRIGLDALARGKTSIVPGFLNRALAWFNRFMPRRMAATLGDRLMR
jgi:uncharacterized protein